MEQKDYKKIQAELETFLFYVGKEIIDLYNRAKIDPKFIELKWDGSIITAGDRVSEDHIRDWIAERFPEDAICGEERAPKQGKNKTWIIDPVDGTYNFSHFGKKFGISVALIENNLPNLGVIFFPAEKILVSSLKKFGATINGRQIKISKGKTELNEAYIIGQAPLRLDDERFRLAAKQQENLLAETKNEDLDWSYTYSFLKFLQNDKVDAILHFGATPYDIAGAVAVAKELDLSVSGYNGENINFEKDIIPIVISKNMELHNKIMKKLRK